MQKIVTKADAAAIADLLAVHSSWRFAESPSSSALVRDYHFADYGAAFAFLAQLALLAERQDHHPDVHWTYNRVSIRLTTHDAGNAVSDRDIDFVRALAAFSGD